MSDGSKSAPKAVYSPPKLANYGDFAKLTAAGSGTTPEGDNLGNTSGNSMRQRP